MGSELPRMRILNKHTSKPSLCRSAVNIMRGTSYGNPFHIGKDGTRLEVVKKYGRWLHDKVDTDDGFRAQVRNLLGRDLLCCCAPKPCHGLLVRDLCYMLNGLTTKWPVWPSPEEISAQEVRGCADCGSYANMFMLRNPVWNSIAKRNTVLCFSCAEIRLGRRIVADDLKMAPINSTLILILNRVNPYKRH